MLMLLVLAAGPPAPFAAGAFQAPSGLVGVVYAPGGRLVVMSLNHGLHEFDARTGEGHGLIGHALWPGIALHPAGDAVLGSGGGGLGVFDLDTRRFRWGAASGGEDAAVWGPGGKWIASLGRGGIVVRFGADGKRVHVIDDERARGGVISASHVRHEVALLGADGTLAVLDPFTGEARWRAVAHSPRSAWPPAGPCVAHAGDVLATGGPDGTVRLWGPDGRPGRVLAMRHAPCRVLAGTPGRLAAAFDDGRVLTFDTRTGRTLASWHAVPTPHRLAFSPDGRELAGVASGSARIALWDGGTGRQLSPRDAAADLAALRILDGGVVGVATRGPSTSPEVISADGRLSASGDAFGITVRDRRTGGPLAQIRVEGIAALALSRDGRRVAAILGPGDVLAWESSDGRQIYHLKQRLAVGGARALMFSPDGGRLAHAQADGRVMVADLGSGTEREAFVLKSRLGRYHGEWALAWSGDGRLAGADDAVVTVWAPDARPRRVWAHGGTMPRVMAFSADGRLLAAGHPVRVWEVASGGVVWTGGAGPAGRRIAFVPDGRLIEAAPPGCAMLWDPSAGAVRAATAEACWGRLAGGDAADALAAVRTLAATPGAAAYLGARLAAPRALTAGRVAGLVKDLDAEEFETRARAEEALSLGAWSAADAMRKALAAGPTLEVRMRLTRILSGWDRSPEALRLSRAVMALERVGTAEARAVLKRLAAGPDGAPVTWEARSALSRLGR